MPCFKLVLKHGGKPPACNESGGGERFLRTTKPVGTSRRPGQCPRAGRRQARRALPHQGRARGEGGMEGRRDGAREGRRDEGRERGGKAGWRGKALPGKGGWVGGWGGLGTQWRSVARGRRSRCSAPVGPKRPACAPESEGGGGGRGGGGEKGGKGGGGEGGGGVRRGRREKEREG